MPVEAIFGILLGKLKDKFPNHIKLPITNIPEEIRKQDPQFRFQVHYRLVSDLFSVGIGPNVISLGHTGHYVGWGEWFRMIKEVLTEIDELNIYEKISRVGLRYINFFQLDNLFDNIDANLTIADLATDNDKTSIRTNVEAGEFEAVINIVGKANVAGSAMSGTGSIIDIDVSLEGEKINPDDLFRLIENAHLEEKNVFYKIMKSEYIATLNPEYS